MDNEDFDQQIRNIYDDGYLPFDAQLWDKINTRLDEHHQSKIIALWQKKLPISYKAMAAIACATIGFIFYVSLIEKNAVEKVNSQLVNSLNVGRVHTGDSALLKNVQAVKANLIAASASRNFQKRAESREPIFGRNMLPKDSVDTSSSVAQQLFNDRTFNKKNTESNPEGSYAHLRDVKFPKELLDKNNEKKPIYFDVLGAYNVNSIKNSFSVGINIKRELRKKLRFDASLSIVGGYNKTFKESERGITPAGLDTAVYKSAINDVFYLQASPSINYRVYEGLYTGLGIDAQRLLNAGTQSVVSDSVGNIIGAQPIWDFGITIKMDYQISNKINAGIIYRESLGGVNNIKSPSISRNYILMQMSYTLF